MLVVLSIMSIVPRCVSALLLNSNRTIDEDVFLRLTLADHHPLSRLLLVLA